MSRLKIWMLVSTLLVVSMLLSACAQPETIVQTVVVTEKGEDTVKTVVATAEPTKAPELPPGPKVLRQAWGPGDIPTIDTALAVDVISIQMVDEMTVGMMRMNEVNAQLEEGMATKWEVSSDGLVYTFHLRDDAPWVRYDGKQVVKVQDCEGKDRMVTADDFVYGILRTLDPDTASDYAYVLTFAIAGAAEYNDGSITDTTKVGVKAVDPKTLEITTLEPAVYNLNILSLWVAHAQPRWIIEGDDCTEGRGDRWTEPGFYQGYGPFVLKEWVHDSYLKLIKNPFWPGSDSIPVSKIDEVLWTFLDGSAAFAEFEAGNLDTVGVPSSDMDRVKADPKYKDMIVQVPTMGTEFYSFNAQLAPTDDARVRKALSMAIDRQSLVDNVNKGSGEPAYWFCRPGLTACPTLATHPDLGVRYDPAKAKELLDEYLKEKGLTADQLNISLMFNTSESHQKRAEAIQQMWKQTLGIDAKLTNQEWKVYLTQRKEGQHSVYRSTWVLDYPDTNNFDREVFGPNGAYSEVVDWQNDKFNELVLQAGKETDTAKRIDLYVQAEKILVEEDAAIAPLYWYRSIALYRPNVVRTDSITGYDWYEKWDLK